MDKSTVVSILGTVVRYGAVAAASAGYIPKDLDPGEITSALVTIGAIVWGAYKTFSHKKQIAAK